MGFLSNMFKKQGEGVFLNACKYGDEPQVKMMLDRSPELTICCDNKGCTGLVYAASNGHNRIISMILSVSAKAVNVLELAACSLRLPI